ncbi:OSB1 [Spatholobus suberectus]|nr:OSB1 [Spatholobus suberectus]
MALEQAVSSSSTLRNVLTFPKTLISKPQFQVASPLWRTQRWKGHGKLKCSVTTASYPKPSEIPWKKELCNSVNLIGVVAAPVEIRHLPSGKVVAWTGLSVKKSATQTSWISLTFWDDLARVASQHLQKGHQIHVSGRLVTDTVEIEEGKSQTYYKVVAQQLNFIERSFSAVSSQDQESDFAMAGSRKVSNAANSTGSVVELWQAFFANPGEWWDNRKKKRNPKAPDFKHKDTGEALWIEGRYNPPWVKSQLEILDTRMGSIAGENARMPVDMVTADEILYF